MLANIRANLWLLVLTVLLCSVIYPLALWGVGQAAFHNKANGSLVHDKDGNAIGSLLIAHEVKGDEYFQPRPSATGGSSWNATASGASNWAANNYLLRDRVARILAGVAKYAKGDKQGELVADDVVAWFRDTQKNPDLVAAWADAHNGLAQAWVKAEDVAKAFVDDWFKIYPDDDELAEWKKKNPLDVWRKKNPAKVKPEAEDLAVPFFKSFAKKEPATWLTVVADKDAKDEKGNPLKHVERVGKTAEDPADIAAVFFDRWRDANPNIELQEVPADMVLASASGLDPHITLKNAIYQLPRVAKKWAKLTGQDKAAATVEDDIRKLLEKHASPPLFGLAGTEIVNVVEMNLALEEQYRHKVKREK